MTETHPGHTRLIGDRYDLVPGQSAFGCIARLARLNYFQPADWHRVFGLRLLRSDDLLGALVVSESRQKALAVALGIELPLTWNPAAWSPFQWPARQDHVWPFRYCLGCIRLGYHPQIHQLPWIERCPWHGIRLRTDCPRCGGRIATSGDADRKLLTCACGLDLMNEAIAARLNRPPEGANEYIARYLAWAARERDLCTLIGPCNAPPEPETLAMLVRLPSGLELRAKSAYDFRAHTRRCRHGIPLGDAQPAEDAKRLKDLDRDRPQMLHVPRFMSPSIHAVAKNLARKLPAGSLTLREQLLFLGGTSDAPSGFVAAQRQSSGTIQCLPPMLAGTQRYLNLAAVHPFISRVIVQLGAAPMDGRHVDDREESRAAALLIRKLQRDVLCRGYAEGLRAVISRYVPEIYFLQRDQPRLTAPWVLLRTDNPCSARIGYVRLDRNDGAADILTAATHPSMTHRR